MFFVGEQKSRADAGAFDTESGRRLRRCADGNDCALAWGGGRRPAPDLTATKSALQQHSHSFVALVYL
ncbi:hypothetical protein Q1695_006026 [Nippostrongylus brasiliensis]|nr:hypothetical protein Q1695_006026 [Nippostrongylus brasiliensis]